jgi:hypothetical protein
MVRKWSAVPISLSYTTPRVRDSADAQQTHVGVVGVWGWRAQVRFCRYRFCATDELKYRGAVGLGYRSTYTRALFVNFKILFVKLYYIGLLKLKAKVAD